MQIYLHPQLTVKEVQYAFRKAFPYLKIEFFNEKYALSGRTFPVKKVSNDTCLIDVKGMMREGLLEFDPVMTAGELELLFNLKYYLPIQVFRRSGSEWLETSVTDRLSLAMQNKKGKESTLPEPTLSRGYYEY